MFEELDDHNPPPPDEVRHWQVVQQIRRTRHRRRSLAAAATVIAVLAMAMGAWAVARHDDQTRVATAPTDQSWASFCAAADRIDATTGARASVPRRSWSRTWPPTTPH